MQSTASAAGASTGTTLVSAFTAYLMISGHHLPMMLTMGLVFFLAMLGVFMAIPMKRNMMNIEQLPFPSGTAGAETLRSLFTARRGRGEEGQGALLFDGHRRPCRVLARRPRRCHPWLHAKFAWFPALGDYALPGYFPTPGVVKWLREHGLGGLGTTIDPKGYTFSLELSTIMIGAGAIMGIRVGVSLLIGAVLAYGVFAPIMHNLPDGHGGMVINALGYRGIVSWTVWGGVSLMTTAALLNFFMQWKTLVRAFSGLAGIFKKKDANAEEDPLARIEVPTWWFVAGVGLAGAATVAIIAWAFNIPVWLGVLSVLISAILAIVACRATGETDTTPIGALGKITQLTYGALIPQNMTANLMTANVTSSIAAASADLLTDLKSGYLLGANPRRQFLAQFSGVFMGALVSVPVFYMLAPTPESVGNDRFPAPSAQVWKAVAELLGKGVHALHPTMLYAIGIGGAAGIAITLLEKAFPKHKHLIPSATGIGLAFVIPAWNCISMFLGAFIAWVLEKKKPVTAEAYIVPVASGLIAGESIMGVAIALCIAVPGLLAETSKTHPTLVTGIEWLVGAVALALVSLFGYGFMKREKKAGA